ncbi:uncharacterized protein LOC122065767 [Macadamia integrifolia]|uniref:uncharacterized protein LOC122065767 n=1 Tax=Macadamia integrifolia TaxID=60698 RepID=UPI001C4F9AF8|nr:uncharacterized protein LOC122065767 [Macadamia integrifolia]
MNSGYSDTAKLKEAAQDVQRLSLDELKRHQLEIKVLIEFLSFMALTLVLPPEKEKEDVTRRQKLRGFSFTAEEGERTSLTHSQAEGFKGSLPEKEKDIDVTRRPQAEGFEDSLQEKEKEVTRNHRRKASTFKGFRGFTVIQFEKLIVESLETTSRLGLRLDFRSFLPWGFGRKRGGNLFILFLFREQMLSAFDFPGNVLLCLLDLSKLGGLAVVILELDNSNLEIRSTSAWIIGKASQNNPVVQKQILELGALKKLMGMVKSSSEEEAAKALYAVSALIRGNLDGQELFYAEGGDLILQDIMRNSSIDIRLRRKSVSLLADLVDFQLANANKQELPFLSNPFFLKNVVDLMSSRDLDLQEKALMAIKSLLQLRTTEALVLKDFCGLDGALERMREHFQQLLSEEYERDFVRDLESLHGEVKAIFHSNLEKGNMGAKFQEH